MMFLNTISINCCALNAAKKEQLAMDMENKNVDIIFAQGTNSIGQQNAIEEIAIPMGTQRYWIIESGPNNTKHKCSGVAIIMNEWVHNAWIRGGEEAWIHGDDAEGYVASGDNPTNEGRWLALPLNFVDNAVSRVEVLAVSTYSPTTGFTAARQRYYRGIKWMKEMAKEKFLICAGDLNSAMGTSSNQDNSKRHTVGPYGIKTTNASGKKTLSKLRDAGMVVMTTFSEHLAPDTGGGTWKHEAHGTWHQNDHIITQDDNFGRFEYARTMSLEHSPTSGDHRGVEARIKIAHRIRQEKFTRKRRMPKDKSKLQTEEGKIKAQRAIDTAEGEQIKKSKSLESLETMMEICHKIEESTSTVEEDEPKVTSFNRAKYKAATEISAQAKKDYERAKHERQPTAEVEQRRIIKIQREAETIAERRKAVAGYRNYYATLARNADSSKERARLQRILQGTGLALGSQQAFMQLEYKGGRRCKTNAEIEEQVLEYLKELVGKKFEGTELEYVTACLNKEGVSLPQIDDTLLGSMPTLLEVTTVIEKLKCGKANLGTSVDALKVLIDYKPEYAGYIHNKLVNHINGTEVIPEMNNVRMTAFVKGNKSPTKAKNHRWICVCHILQKVMDTIFTNRLKQFVMDRIGISQCGFIEGREGLDATMMLNRIVQTRKQQGKSTHILFMDAIGAFPRLSREVMMECLKAFGLGARAMQWVYAMYNDTFVTAAVNGGEVGLKANAGGIQGAVATPILYIIVKYMCDRSFKVEHQEFTNINVTVPIGPTFQSPQQPEAMHDASRTENTNSVTFADDEAAMQFERDSMARLANAITTHSAKFSIQIHKDFTNSKTILMLIPGNNKSRDKNLMQPIELDDKTGRYQYKESIVHIGQLLDHDWTFEKDRDSRIGRANKEWKKIQWIAENENETIEEKMKWYNEKVLPQLVQNSEIWSIERTRKVINWHTDKIRRICNDTDSDIAEVCETAEDCGMEAHLDRRLLQWVGRAARKHGLGEFALKGTLSQNGSTEDTEPTDTDKRITAALDRLATATEEQMMREETLRFQTIVKNQFVRWNAKEVVKALRTGRNIITPAHKDTAKCQSCNDDKRYKIEYAHTINARSQLHEHFKTCKHRQFRKPETPTQKRMQETANQQATAAARNESYTWETLAKNPGTWKRLLKHLGYY